MRKQYGLLVLIQLMAFACLAQKKPDVQGRMPAVIRNCLEYSVYIQPQFTLLYNKADFDTGKYSFINPGVEAGMRLAYHFPKVAGIELGLAYSMHQQKYDLKPGVVQTIDIRFIKVPLLFTFRSNTAQKAYFHAGFGAQFSAVAAGQLLDRENEKREYGNFLLGYQKMNVDVLAEMGVKVRLGDKFLLSLLFRGSAGMLDIEAKKATYVYENYYQGIPAEVRSVYAPERPQTWPISLGFAVGGSYLIGLKRKE